MTTIDLPGNVVFLTGGLLSTAWVLTYQKVLVSKHRSAAAIDPLHEMAGPTDSSPAARQYNCAKFAHQSTLDSVPSLYATTLITALKYPAFAALSLIMWSASRILFTREYVTGDRAKRNRIGGFLASAALLSLLLSSTYVFGLVVLDVIRPIILIKYSVLAAISLSICSVCRMLYARGHLTRVLANASWFPVRCSGAAQIVASLIGRKGIILLGLLSCVGLMIGFAILDTEIFVLMATSSISILRIALRLLISSLQSPILTTVSLGIFSICRVLYSHGYAKRDTWGGYLVAFGLVLALICLIIP